MFTRLFGGLMISAVLFLAFANVGCNQKLKPDDKKQQAKTDDNKKDIPRDDHSGWWCQPHGIPEDICSLCNAEHAEKLKKEGDWCKLHDRAASQCFKCDPSKYEKFEAMYMAKYNGKKPERPPEDEFKK
jgi:hypothetical protein